LLTPKRKDDLASRLSEHFGETLRVDIALTADVGETPVQEESRLADERIEAARRSLEADPNVQALKDMFGAELKAETIELNKPSQSDQRNS
jgi:DNA polymerase-3 subunit gamma/tau